MYTVIVTEAALFSITVIFYVASFNVHKYFMSSRSRGSAAFVSENSHTCGKNEEHRYEYIFTDSQVGHRAMFTKLKCEVN